MITTSGLKPLVHDHRDYDFLKTKRLGGIVPAFPAHYTTEVGLWNPDQNALGLPYGCTSCTMTDLHIDQEKKLFDLMDIENITHSNSLGGIDMRTAMRAFVKLYPDHVFLNVRPDLPEGGALDWFDAVRVAILVGKDENRAVSVGTPWFPMFSEPKAGVMQMIISWALQGIFWHNWAVKGWHTINGVEYLIGKPWLGALWGDNGFCYFSRPIFNRLMSIQGTGAFVLDKLLPGEVPHTISSSAKDLLVSFFTQLFMRLFHI